MSHEDWSSLFFWQVTFNLISIRETDYAPRINLSSAIFLRFRRSCFCTIKITKQLIKWQSMTSQSKINNNYLDSFLPESHYTCKHRHQIRVLATRVGPYEYVVLGEYSHVPIVSRLLWQIVLVLPSTCLQCVSWTFGEAVEEHEFYLKLSGCPQRPTTQSEMSFLLG